MRSEVLTQAARCTRGFMEANAAVQRRAERSEDRPLEPLVGRQLCACQTLLVPNAWYSFELVQYIAAVIHE